MRRTLEIEVRQFRRLVRLSYGRMLDAALGSRDIDAAQFVIWGGALLATPPLFYVLKATSAYPWLRHRSLDALQTAALADRLFFIIWAMLAAVLLVSLMWDGLFPDRTDQQVLGVLPVRSRTVAAARLAAALSMGLGFIAAISAPTAVVYSVFGAVHPIIGSRSGVLLGHLIATVTAGLFTLCMLLSARGLLVFVVGAALAARAALLLQLVTVLLLVEVFLFLPGILPAIVQPLLTPGVAADTWLPPAWFLGLYARLGRPYAELLGALSAKALVATAVAVVTATVVYIAPAAWIARRAVETRAAGGGGHLAEWFTWVVSRCVMTPASRAMVAFTLRSLLRNTRPLLIVCTWLGLGIAVAGLRLVSATLRGRPLPLDQPTDYLLALPMVLSFFIACGLRAAFAVPTDGQANWTFRLATGERTDACVDAVRAILLLSAVVPVSIALAAVGGWLWGWAAALQAAALHFTSGMLLCELAVLDCQAIPFARHRGLSTATLKVGAPLALVGLNLYAFQLDDVQLMALSVQNGVIAYVIAFVLATAALSWVGRRHRLPVTLAFDAPAEATPTRLKLSGATG